MIMILAFAAWTLLLGVVGAMTGVTLLMNVAGVIGGLAVGSALLVLFVEMQNPNPRAARAGAHRLSHAAA